MPQVSPPLSTGLMPRVLDRAEFGHLFQAHARVLWVVAAAFVPADAVEDVLQDAAATALARLPEFDPDTSFRAWMTQIVRFTAANVRRRARRRAAEPLAGDPVQPAGNGAPPVARDGSLHELQAEFDDRVLRALDELPAIARACLLLRVVLDLGYAEIGETLGLPEGTVASHVHRARAALRRILGGERGDGRPATPSAVASAQARTRP